MTTFTTQDRQDADDAIVKALGIVLKALKRKYNNIGDNYMGEELWEAYSLLAQLHDASVLSSKPGGFLSSPAPSNAPTE
jgi:hypothetical protein